MVRIASRFSSEIQLDIVELRQVLAGGQVAEPVVQQPRVGAGGLGQRAGVRGVGGVEVGAPVVSRIARRDDVERHALAVPQLQIAHGRPDRPALSPAVRRRIAGHQQGEVDHPRRQLAVIAVGVVDVGAIAGRPVHARFPLMSGRCRRLDGAVSCCSRAFLPSFRATVERTPMLIQKYRLRHGWSQEQLAELSGLSVRRLPVWNRSTPSRPSSTSISPV